MASLSTCPPLTRESVQAAHEIVKPYIHLTPVLTSTAINAIVSASQTVAAPEGTENEAQRSPEPKINLYFKCENFQRIGAFKVRGAFHAVSRLPEDVRKKGIVTHSSGNHAQAAALAARTFGVPAHIIMPRISTPSKVAATRALGATIHFSGSTAAEREKVTEEVLSQLPPGTVVIPPYNHPDIILGQGTVALELEQQVGEMGVKLDAVIAPCGGGGMLSGVATALHGTGVRVYGAEPNFQGANDAQRGLAQGERITEVSTLTIADGLRTPLGDITWKVISDKEKVKNVYSVSEDQIKAAMKLLMERMKLFVEPSACVGLAVALFDEGFRKTLQESSPDEGWNIGIILTGGNTTVEAVAELFGQKSGGA